MKKVALLALLAATPLAGCMEARIAMPAEVVEATDRLALTGIGGWQNGRFQVGASSGRFTRRASEQKIDDVLIHEWGGATFDAAGPEFGGQASGRCRFEQGEIDAGIAVLPHRRLTYRCRFDRAGAPVGDLVIAEVPLGSGLLAGRSRAGELRLGGTTVQVQAIHHDTAGSIMTGTPLGYRFSSGGRQIGAIDLNGGTRTIYAPRAAGPEREAVLMGSLALALFRDPGD